MCSLIAHVKPKHSQNQFIQHALCRLAAWVKQYFIRANLHCESLFMAHDVSQILYFQAMYHIGVDHLSNVSHWSGSFKQCITLEWIIIRIIAPKRLQMTALQYWRFRIKPPKERQKYWIKHGFVNIHAQKVH
jgi:hypothetical protein